MIALLLWFLYGLILSTFGAFVASHYFRLTLRQQAAIWLSTFLLAYTALALSPIRVAMHLPFGVGWTLSTAVPFSRAALPLGIAYGLFALFIAYFIPRYERLGLGDPQGTVRQVVFPFRSAALTFDDGPSPQWTLPILDVLDRHQVKATFFLVGTGVEAHPEVVREIARRGHSIGNHSYSHRCMPLLDARTLVSEIDRGGAAIEKAIGQRPRYFRPPWGMFNRRVLDELRARGYLTVLWSKSSQDWRNPGVDEIERRAAGAPQMGDILLFHDGGNYPSKGLPSSPRAQTVEGVDRVIRRLESMGFQLKSIDDMVAAWLS